VHDRDLQPNLIASGDPLIASGDPLIDRRLHLPLQSPGQGHRSKRHVVWLKASPLRNPRPRTGRTRNTIARPPNDR